MSQQLPQYESHETVGALRIVQIMKLSNDLTLRIDPPKGWLIIPAERGFDAFEVDEKYMEKHQPQIGGYFIQYEGGSRSYAPADFFSKGYSLKGGVKDCEVGK